MVRVSNAYLRNLYLQVGIATCIVAFIGLALWPVVGVGYFWWWLLFFIWFLAVGWKLYRLGST
jgi:hypothetical protein